MAISPFDLRLRKSSCFPASSATVHPALGRCVSRFGRTAKPLLRRGTLGAYGNDKGACPRTTPRPPGALLLLWRTDPELLLQLPKVHLLQAGMRLRASQV